MRTSPINGWTRERMIEAVEKHVPDTVKGCRNKDGYAVMINSEGERCAIGAFLSAEDARKYNGNNPHGIPLELLPIERFAAVQLQITHDLNPPRGTETARAACIRWIKAHVWSSVE